MQLKFATQLRGLCHGCLVHWVNFANNASKELDVNVRFTYKIQNHNFVSNKVISLPKNYIKR